MDETTYHGFADRTLDALAAALEPFYDSGAIEELDAQGGMVNIVALSGRVYLVSKHTASRQIWFASPVSGGLHFSYAPADGCWRLSDGRSLEMVLMSELRAEQIEVML